MTASNREASISKTLTYEGGYTNDPRDPGGATNWGITIIDARLYWKHDAAPSDVKAMPKSVAIDIYRQKYWAKMDCDNQPTGPDFVDFDFGVNSGVSRALKYRAQLAPRNLSPVAYVKAQCAMRSSFLHGLKTWAVFGKGWGSRVADVEATGVRMALTPVGEAVDPTWAEIVRNDRLQTAAKAATKKAAVNTGAATVTTAAPAGLPDFTTKVGLIVFGVVAVTLIAYFLWNAVQNSHRAAAYKAQLK